MTSTIKLLANSQAITTTNNSIGSAKLVRIVNTDTATALITLFDTVANTQLGTITVGPSQELFLQKAKTDAIVSNNNTLTLASKIGFSY